MTWLLWQKGDAYAQEVIPLEDLIEHTTKACTCGPTVTFERVPGTIHCVQRRVHHALDGRKQIEEQDTR